MKHVMGVNLNITLNEKRKTQKRTYPVIPLTEALGKTNLVRESRSIVIRIWFGGRVRN